MSEYDGHQYVGIDLYRRRSRPGAGLTAMTTSYDGTGSTSSPE